MRNHQRIACILVLFSAPFLLLSCATGASRQRYDTSGFSGLSGVSGLFEPPVNEDVNGFLPEEVFIKTRTQTFCAGYQFCLVDGRIYYKRLPPAGGNGLASGGPESDGAKPGPGSWVLLTKTGLPHSARRGFLAPKRVIEIVADADALFALSETGRLYRCYFDIKTASPSLEWADAFGWPDMSPIQFNDQVAGNRGWSLGARRDHVLWYDDPNGNQHHFGTMGIETIYFLDSDGQGLRYADTGLPSDFSHGILGPERGAFVAEAISASASTVFLINAAGESYTRLADFDTLGCDPMFFKYTYRKENHGLAGSDFWSNFTPWALPNEEWRKQPPIPVSGAARLTRRISIHQDGQGNASRELRVAGISSEGEIGFYAKRIFAPEWEFRAAPLELFPADFLDREAVASGVGQRGQRHEAAYYGSLFSGGDRDGELSFEVPDFPMIEGDCRLLVRRGEESAELRLYPVEIWTYLKRYDPGRDGTPRLFHLTAKLPEDRFAGLTPEFRARLEALFGGIDLKLFAGRIEAMEDYLFIEFPDDGISSADYLFLTKEGVPLLDKELYRKRAGYRDRLVARYLDPDLDIRFAGELTIARRSRIEEIIRLNEEYRGELDAELELFRSYRFSSGLSRWGYGAVDLVTSVTFLDQIDFPKIKTMTSYGDKIMEANEKGYRQMAESREWVYAKLIELSDLRIAEYRRVIAAFDANEVSAELSPRYRDSFDGYFGLLGLTDRIEGTSPAYRGKRAEVERLEGMPLFPGLVLSLERPTRKDPEARSSLLMELKDSARIAYSMSDGDLPGKPFRARLSFHAISADGGFEEAKGGRTGSIEWDGSELRVWRDKPFFVKELLFRGRAAPAVDR